MQGVYGYPAPQGYYPQGYVGQAYPPQAYAPQVQQPSQGWSCVLVHFLDLKQVGISLTPSCASHTYFSRIEIIKRMRR